MNTPVDQEHKKSDEHPNYRSQYSTFREEKLDPPIERFDDNRGLWIVGLIVIATFLLVALVPQIGILAGAAVGMAIFGIWVVYTYLRGNQNSQNSRREDE